jgi:hypothetical protein
VDFRIERVGVRNCGGKGYAERYWFDGGRRDEKDSERNRVFLKAEVIKTAE